MAFHDSLPKKTMRLDFYGTLRTDKLLFIVRSVKEILKVLLTNLVEPDVQPALAKVCLRIDHRQVVWPILGAKRHSIVEKLGLQLGG
jgi:hypothetical protein